MAVIANSAFEARMTNGHFDETLNITGHFQNSTPADEACAAGFLCTRGDKLPAKGFSGVYNENAYYMAAATSSATANDLIYACNPYDWQLVSGNGADFAMGVNTLGLGIPAGREGTFTQILFDGKSIYRFGVGNTSGSISTNKYFTIDAGLLKTAASAPTGNGDIYFEIVGTGKFTEGCYASFTYYDVIGHTVVA